MVTTRKDQSTLTPAEWGAFTTALTALRGMGPLKPRYGTFVDVHVKAMSMAGMTWGVHTMPQMHMFGRNFLSWHRRYILRFEQQLQRVDASVALPYWDTIANPNIPPALNIPAFVAAWGLIRNWDASLLPIQHDLDAANARTTFTPFQSTLESMHNKVHVAVGGIDPNTSGQMSGANSPADPLFWLHHANIDRIWSKWEVNNPGQNPPNMNEVLKPSPIISGKVSDYQSITALGYKYL